MTKILSMTLLLLFMPLGNAFAQAPATVGTIDKVDGEAQVQIIEGKTGKVREAKKGDPLFEDDKIVTKAGQTVTLELKDRSEIIIAPASSFKIEQFTTGRNQTTILDLFYGMARSLVRRHYGENETFAVKTSSAVMGVRGTSFLVEVDKDSNETTLTTLHGKVAMAASLQDLKNPTLVVMVPAGQSSQMRSGMRRADPPSSYDKNKLKERLYKKSSEFQRNLGSDPSDPTSALQTQSQQRADNNVEGHKAGEGAEGEDRGEHRRRHNTLDSALGGSHPVRGGGGDEAGNDAANAEARNVSLRGEDSTGELESTKTHKNESRNEGEGERHRHHRKIR